MRLPGRSWLSRRNDLTATVFTVAALSLLSRLLGVFRDRVLAGQFGAGDELDVYYAAFRIPDLIYNIVIAGALSAGFIPVFVAARERRGKDEHWAVANNIITVGAVAVSVICLAMAVAAPWLIPLTVPGFPAQKTIAVVALTRIMLLSPLLLGISGVVSGVIQVYRKFFIFGLAPVFYNVGIIVGALFLSPRFGLPGLAWGVIAGASLHLLVQLPTAYNLRWPFRLLWEPRNRDAHSIFRLMMPRSLTVSLSQLNLFLLTILASLLSAGSLAIFNLASNLFMMPAALIGVSYAVVAFPSLAEQAAGGKSERFQSTVRQGMQHLLLFAIPATVLLLLLRAQLVRATLGAGAFDWADTVLTFQTLQWLSLSLFAQIVYPFLIRTLFALRDTITPLFSGLAATLVGVGTSLQLFDRYGVAGLAIGFSVGMIVNVACLWFSLRWQYGSFGEAMIVKMLAYLTPAGAVMAIVTQGTKVGVGVFLGTDTFLRIVAQGMSAALAGLAAYVAMFYLLRVPEMCFVAKQGVYRETTAALRLQVEREGLPDVDTPST